MNIYKKINKLRREIAVKKSGYNNYGNFSYYELNYVYNSVKKKVDELNLFIHPPTFKMDGEFIIATLRITDIDDPESEIYFETVGTPNIMKGAQPAQNAGSDVTYHTKYLYCLLLQLDDGLTDPDAQQPDAQQPDAQPDTQQPDTQQPDTQQPDAQPDTQPEKTKVEAYRKHCYNLLRKTGHDIKEINKLIKMKWGDDKTIQNISISEMKQVLKGMLTKLYKENKKEFNLNVDDPTEKIIKTMKKDGVIK
jgi:hypothetical protein